MKKLVKLEINIETAETVQTGGDQAVVQKRRVRCGRCGSGEIDGPRWENGWPNYGTIDLGYASQAFGALCGMKYCAAPEHFAVWEEGHPAMTDNGAQHVRFEWNTGKNDFRLCRSCQTDLFQVVGDFFGFPRRAKELSSANA